MNRIPLSLQESPSVVLEPLAESRLTELAPIIKRAFDHDSLIHTGVPEDGPSGYEDGSLLRRLAFERKHPSYRVVVDGMTAGGAVVAPFEEGAGELELLFLDPSFQSRGVGLRVWQLIEAAYPNILRWRLETPGYSLRNHAFYIRKCGFEYVESRNPGHPRDESFILAKNRKELSPPMITIRKVRTGDLPQLAELYEELVQEPSVETNMRETFARIEADDRYCLLGAFEDERLAGSAMGIFCYDLIGDCRPFMVVENVIVSERFRGQKAGKLLMEELERLAKARNCGYAILVSSGFRKEAHAFYESLGYTEDVRGFRRRLD